MCRHHSAAITKCGRLYTWGHGKSGRLGHGNEHVCMLPTRVEGLTHHRVTDVATAESHTAALTCDGELYSWGRDRFGQVRNANRTRLLGYEADIHCSFCNRNTYLPQVSEDCRHVEGVWARHDPAYPPTKRYAYAFVVLLCACNTCLRYPCVLPRAVVIVSAGPWVRIEWKTRPEESREPEKGHSGWSCRRF